MDFLGRTPWNHRFGRVMSFESRFVGSTKSENRESPLILHLAAPSAVGVRLSGSGATLHKRRFFRTTVPPRRASWRSSVRLSRTATWKRGIAARQAPFLQQHASTTFGSLLKLWRRTETLSLVADRQKFTCFMPSDLSWFGGSTRRRHHGFQQSQKAKACSSARQRTVAIFPNSLQNTRR